MSDLASKSCSPRSGPALDRAAAERLLAQVPGWTLVPAGNEIQRAGKFRDHFAALAFVNAVAWISHREDHHPDLRVGYNTVTVTYSTHSVGGLSENDFICAAKIDALGAL